MARRITDDEKAHAPPRRDRACFPALGGESFGIVLLEAMAAGTPVVASAIEGYRNVARPDHEALLVPPGDVDALRAALRRCSTTMRCRDALIAAGRTRADEFSMARLAERYIALYERRSPITTGSTGRS